MKIIFKESHVGQKVNCLMFGNGVIEAINLQHRYLKEFKIANKLKYKLTALSQQHILGLSKQK